MKKNNKKGTGFVCNYEFMMRNSCSKCPIARICQEFEENENNKVSNTKTNEQSNNKRKSKAKQIQK